MQLFVCPRFKLPWLVLDLLYLLIWLPEVICDRWLINCQPKGSISNCLDFVYEWHFSFAVVPIGRIFSVKEMLEERDYRDFGLDRGYQLICQSRTSRYVYDKPFASDVQILISLACFANLVASTFIRWNWPFGPQLEEEWRQWSLQESIARQNIPTEKKRKENLFCYKLFCLKLK